MNTFAQQSTGLVAAVLSSLSDYGLYFPYGTNSRSNSIRSDSTCQYELLNNNRRKHSVQKM